MMEALVFLQDISRFSDIMSISSFDLDDLIAKTDGFFNFYNEDEDLEKG